MAQLTRRTTVKWRSEWDFFLVLQRHLKLAVLLMTVVRYGMLSKLTAITSYAHRDRRACVNREKERKKERE